MGHHKDDKDDDDSSTFNDTRRREKRSRKHKRHKEKKKRQQYRSDSSSESSSRSDVDRHRKKRKRKEHKKESKKKHIKRARNEAAKDDGSAIVDRNTVLADALCNLFQAHPALAEDLPIMLIRMGGGASFDLSQMTNRHASLCLGSVFQALQPVGVNQDDVGAWTWTGPKNDLVLIRVVRAMLDQVGFTEDAIHAHGEKLVQQAEQKQRESAMKLNTETTVQLTKDLLREFSGKGQLYRELAGLCSMILEGESISLDSLPDEKLRTSLEELFSACYLKKYEMEDDDEDVRASASDEPAMGYALPDSDNEEFIKSLIKSVIQVCRDEEMGRNTVRRPVAGPMLQPDAYADQKYHAAAADESDDEGPSPFILQAARSNLSTETIKAAAEKRAQELQYAKTGVMPEWERDETIREEWMVDPGKFDFLQSITSGPARSRGFQAQGAVTGEQAITAKRRDSKIQAEIDSILQAHEDARGPSLVELHRQKKAQDATKSTGKKDESWKWDRDKDLDSGRRVDKANLNLVLGGAGSDLKNRFHGGL
jgi:hypothetical protein